MDPRPLIERCVDEVQRWAAANDSVLHLGPPVAREELAALPERIRPRFGVCRYTLPPSYQAFLEVHGGAWVEVEGERLRWPFCIYGPDEIVARTRAQVHLPPRVSRGDGRELSTNHFVAFAAARAYDDECWCFDTEASGPELPVYSFNQNLCEGAKLVDGGGWESEAEARPGFDGFVAWLEAETRLLVEMKAWGL